MIKGRFGKSDIWLFVGSALTLLLTIAAVVFSLGFTSTSLYRALSPGEKAEATVHFDVAGYNALELQ